MLDRLVQSLDPLIALVGDPTAMVVTAFGLAAALFALSALHLLTTATSASRRRVRAVVNEVGSTDGRASRRVENAIAPVRSLVLPKSEKEIGAVRRRLAAAGHRAEGAMALYYVWKLGLMLLFGLIALAVTPLFPTLSALQVSMLVMGAVFAGNLLPSHVLDRQVAARKRRIFNAFPDMLDMLVTCSEAGLGLNAALQRVARELDVAFPDLAEELELVNAEMLAGVDKVQALRGLCRRTDIEEISGFVSMLSQSLRFGTGIAEALRIYADDFRDRRMQRAEELAAKVGTKLIFPLVLCMFPAFFVVAVGPAAIAVMNTFAGN